MKRTITLLALTSILLCATFLTSCAATGPTPHITQTEESPQGETGAANPSNEPGANPADDIDGTAAVDAASAAAAAAVGEQREPHEQPAAQGQPLAELEQPPVRTLARFEVASSAPHPLYYATIEPFGTRGALGDNPPREIIARIVSWEPASGDVEDQLPDLTGRNASFQVGLSSEEVQPLLVGGQHRVIVRILSDGSTGSLAIEEVR